MIIGSIVAIATPMHEDGAIDYKRFKSLVEWHQREGTSAIVVAGSTGESATLEVDEHQKLFACAVEYSDGKIPVIAGIGANSTKEAIHLAQAAKDAGAVAGLSVVPYYNKPMQEGMFRHFSTVAAHCDLPQILYNIPGRTVVDMHNDTILRLAELPTIVGLKDATSNLGRAFELFSSAPADFAFYAGDDDTALAYMLTGGHGVISVTANLAPKLVQEMCTYAIAGDGVKAREIYRKLMPLTKAMSLETNPIPVKYAMQQLKLIEGGLRLPLTALNKNFRSTVDAVVRPFEI